MSIKDTLVSVIVNKHVHHIHDNGRTVAIRLEYKRLYKNKGTLEIDKPTRRVSLTFSDEKVDLRSSDDTRRNLTARQAERAINTFLYGQRVKVKHDQCELLINQAKRWCWIEETTPTRLRLTYDMPNAGEMSGWWKYIAINNFHYIANY